MSDSPGAAAKKICVALDVNKGERAIQLAKLLNNHVGFFKIGLELFSACGPSVVSAVAELGTPIFLDLKLHDIPNTVGHTARVLTRLGVSMFNVHATGGSEMIRAAVDAAQEESAKSSMEPPKILAVTILTSINSETLMNDLQINTSVENAVRHFASMAEREGAAGVVASPHEIECVRKTCGNDFLIVTPGVRPIGSTVGDQKRVTTPAQAIRSGSDYIVIGRPIIAAEDPLAEAISIAKEIADAI